MEEVIKEDKNKSHKEFEQLLSEDLGNRSFREGEITTGIVEEIGKKICIHRSWSKKFWGYSS